LTESQREGSESHSCTRHRLRLCCPGLSTAGVDRAPFIAIPDKKRRPVLSRAESERSISHHDHPRALFHVRKGVCPDSALRWCCGAQCKLGRPHCFGMCLIVFSRTDHRQQVAHVPRAAAQWAQRVGCIRRTWPQALLCVVRPLSPVLCLTKHECIRVHGHIRVHAHTK